MPRSELPTVPLGWGTDTAVQVTPFQVSASGSVASDASSYEPTATQFDTAGHETPVNFVERAPAGGGGIWSDHVFFERTSGMAVGVPFGADSLYPAAMQDERLGQATAVSSLKRSPLGLGVVRLDHFVPFHRSAKVLVSPLSPAVPMPTSPTAKQTLVSGQEAP